MSNNASTTLRYNYHFNRQEQDNPIPCFIPNSPTSNTHSDLLTYKLPWILYQRQVNKSLIINQQSHIEMLMLFSNLDFVRCFYNLAPMQEVGICKFVSRLHDSFLLPKRVCFCQPSIVRLLNPSWKSFCPSLLEQCKITRVFITSTVPWMG